MARIRLVDDNAMNCDTLERRRILSTFGALLPRRLAPAERSVK